MRFLMKVRITVEAGNRLAREGRLGTVIESILSKQKPESVYFGLEDGQRTAFIITNLNNASELPAFAEPWFLAFDAELEAIPVMTPEDLAKAGPSIGEAVEKYG